VQPKSRTHFPEAAAFLTALPEADRTANLAANPGIAWDGTTASFDWPQFIADAGPRKKGAPAFDSPRPLHRREQPPRKRHPASRNFTETEAFLDWISAITGYPRA
jgi:hypothetical protein